MHTYISIIANIVDKTNRERERKRESIDTLDCLLRCSVAIITRQLVCYRTYSIWHNLQYPNCWRFMCDVFTLHQKSRLLIMFTSILAIAMTIICSSCAVEWVEMQWKAPSPRKNVRPMVIQYVLQIKLAFRLVFSTIFHSPVWRHTYVPAAIEVWIDFGMTHKYADCNYNN